MKRYFYYLETEDEQELFDYLNNQVDEGYIDYQIIDVDDVIVIDSFIGDDIFDELVDKYDLIEDYDYGDVIIDEDYDDFYSDDDLET